MLKFLSKKKTVLKLKYPRTNPSYKHAFVVNHIRLPEKGDLIKKSRFFYHHIITIRPITLLIVLVEPVDEIQHRKHVRVALLHDAQRFSLLLLL